MPTPVVAGAMFGWLTVIGDGPRDKRNKRTVQVRCRCGREYSVQPAFLRKPEPKCRNCSNAIKSRISHGAPDFHFQITGSSAVGTLPSGDTFIIDVEDIPRVSCRHWYKKADQNYILNDTKENGKLVSRVRLHRFLMGLDNDDARIVDHINRNPMDCRKSNMRIATQAQNCLNKSARSNNTTGYIGVHKSSGKFQAAIWIAGKDIRLIRCEDRVLCAQMYNHAARLLYGEFVGELNDVPEADPETKRCVEELCEPYMEIAAVVTASVDDRQAREVVA